MSQRPAGLLGLLYRYRGVEALHKVTVCRAADDCIVREIQRRPRPDRSDSRSRDQES
jgi:hypothetical protein